jgi:hypothetical protein
MCAPPSRRRTAPRSVQESQPRDLDRAPPPLGATGISPSKWWARTWGRLHLLNPSKAQGASSHPCLFRGGF